MEAAGFGSIFKKQCLAPTSLLQYYRMPSLFTGLVRVDGAGRMFVFPSSLTTSLESGSGEQDAVDHHGSIGDGACRCSASDEDSSSSSDSSSNSDETSSSVSEFGPRRFCSSQT